MIFLRLTTTNLAVKIERLNHVLAHFGDRLDQFLVVTERSVRTRPVAPTLPSPQDPPLAHPALQPKKREP